MFYQITLKSDCCNFSIFHAGNAARCYFHRTPAGIAVILLSLIIGTIIFIVICKRTKVFQKWKECRFLDRDIHVTRRAPDLDTITDNARNEIIQSRETRTRYSPMDDYDRTAVTREEPRHIYIVGNDNSRPSYGLPSYADVTQSRVTGIRYFPMDDYGASQSRTNASVEPRPIYIVGNEESRPVDDRLPSYADVTQSRGARTRSRYSQMDEYGANQPTTTVTHDTPRSIHIVDNGESRPVDSVHDGLPSYSDVLRAIADQDPPSYEDVC